MRGLLGWARAKGFGDCRSPLCGGVAAGPCVGIRLLLLHSCWRLFAPLFFAEGPMCTIVCERSHPGVGYQGFLSSDFENAGVFVRTSDVSSGLLPHVRIASYIVSVVCCFRDVSPPTPPTHRRRSRSLSNRSRCQLQYSFVISDLLYYRRLAKQSDSAETAHVSSGVKVPA